MKPTDEIILIYSLIFLFLQKINHCDVGKTIKITIAIVLMVLSIPLCTRWFSTVKYYFSDEGKQATSSLKYRVTAKTAEVTGIEENCKSETIIIPEKVICYGYLCTVTSIGNHAFYGCSEIKSVKIPSSVKKIGRGAFYGCSGLTSIKIPMSVREIGDEAFKDCIGLTSVEIPTSVEENEYGRIVRSTRICSGAFKNCYNSNIVIGNYNRATVVGDPFEGCKSVTWK